MKNSRSIYILLSFVFVFLFNVEPIQAAISVSVDIPANTTPNLAASYSSLALALADLNAVTGMSGPVILTLSGSETAPPSGFTIGSATLNPILSAVNTITLIQNGGATINAGIGTATPSSATPDGILKLNGADYVTLNGLTLIDGNAANPATMEFGIGLFKRSAGDGCNNNTIQNCTISLQRINNASSTSPMIDGATGILMVNSTPTAATTVLAPTNGGTLATNGTNSANKFYSNQINGGNYGIGLSGYAATVGIGPSPTAVSFLGDLANDIGGTSLSTGNTILNYGGAPAATNPSAGIRVNSQWSVNISYNTVNNNNGSGVNHVITLRGVYAQSASSASATINNNNITLQSGATTSACTALENGIGGLAASNLITINNNVISGAYSTATTGVFTGILNLASATTVNINGNTISGTAPNSLAGTGTHIMIETGSPANVTVNNNTINNLSRNGASGSWRGIKTTSPANFTANGNTIENISWTLLSSTGSFDAIYCSSSTINVTANNNIIRNISIPTTGTINGIREFGVSGSKNFLNNQIYNFTTTAGGAGGATFNGIFCSVGNITVSTNQVYSLNSSGTTGGTAGTIYGIQISGGTTINVSKNRICDLSSSSTNPIVAGINVSGGTTNTISNNRIADLRGTAANAANPVVGLNITGGTTINVYFNTISLNAVSSGALFGSSAISSSTTPALTLNNNIFVNNSIASGTGSTVAYRRSSTTLSTYANTSNRNNFFAPVIFSDGTNSFITLGPGAGTYKNFMVSPRDANSISENTPFLSTNCGDPAFLKVNTATQTGTESSASNISGITDDFENDIRQGNPGYAGSGTAPDMGADEYNGTPLPSCQGQPAASTIIGASGVCSGNGTTLSLSTVYTDLGLTYQWSSGTVPGGPYPNTLGTLPSQSTGNLTVPTYFVCTINCVSSGQSFTTVEKSVLINPFPAVTLTPSAASYCIPGGIAVTLTSNGATTYTYSPTAGLTPTSGPVVSAAPSAVTTYTVTGTDANGCVKTASTVIGLAVNPTNVTASASPSFICTGLTSNLTSTGSILYTANQYSFSYNATSGTLEPMTGATTVVGSSVDDAPMALSGTTAGASQTIGFNFIYEGVTYTHFSASPDGWIQLKTTTAAATAQATNAISSATNAPKISPYWDDLATGTTGSVKTLVIGTAPNRIFVLQWFVTIPRNTTGVPNSRFQAWLYETTGQIEFRYGTMGTATGTVSSGLTGVTSSKFSSITFSTNTTSVVTANDAQIPGSLPANGTLYSFAPPASPSFSWSPAGDVVSPNAQNTITNALTANKTFTVTATSGVCSVSASTTVSVDPLQCQPAILSGSPCVGSNFTLTASKTGGGSPFTYSWNDGVGGVYPNTETVTANLPVGTYTFYCTITDGCGAQCVSSLPVTVNSLPNVSINPTNGVICNPGGTPVNLLANGAVTYAWSPATGLSATTGPSVTAAPASTTTYTVIGTDANGCSNTASSGIVSVLNPIGFTASATPSTICAGAITNLSATGTIPVNVNQYAFSYNGSSGILNPMTGATTVVGSSIDDAPMALTGTTAGASQPIGFNFVYEGVNYSHFSASPDGWILLGNSTAAAANQFTNAINSGTNAPKISAYWDDLATGTTGNVKTLISGSAPNRIFIVQWFVTIPRNTAGAPNSTFQAWLYETSGQIQFRYGTMGTATGTVSSGLTGATSTNFNSITFSTNTSSSVTANDGQIPGALPLNGTLYSFTPPSGLTFSWSPAIDVVSPNAQNTATNPLSSSGNFTVTISNSGCSVTASTSVTVNSIPAAPTANNSTQCGIAVPTASVNGVSGPYNWYLSPTGGSPLSGQTGTSLTGYSINTTTTFYVSEYNGTCESPRTALIANVDLPDAVTASVATPTCTGTPFTLEVTKAPGVNVYTYSWNGSPLAGSGLSGPTSGDILDGHLSITPTASGTYTYTVTASGGGCITNSSLVLTVSNYPVIDSVIASPNTLCSGGLVNLNAYSAAIGSGSTIEPTGYLASSATNTADDEIFNVTISGTTLNNSSTCSTLAPGPGSIVTRYSNYTTSVSAPVLLAGNTYNGTVTIGQCLTTAFTTGYAVFIDLNRNGTFDVPSERVYGEANTTSAVAGTVKPFSFLIPLSASPGLTRMRIVAVESANGATGGIAPTGTYSWGETEDYLVSIQNIVPQNAALTYTWTNAAAGIPGYSAADYPTNLSSIPSTASYTVTVSNGGCNAIGSVNVTVNPLPLTPVKQDDSQCGPGLPTCYVTGGSGTFRWYLTPIGGTPIAGETNSYLTSYNINSTTTFYVSEFNGLCESDRIEVIQTVNDPGPITVSTTSSGCIGSALVLNVSNPMNYPYLTYDWSSSPQAGSGMTGIVPGNPVSGQVNITPTAIGTYTYTVLASDGTCNAFGITSVSIRNIPSLDSIVANPKTICSGSPVTLNAYSNIIGTGPQTPPTGYPGLTTTPGTLADEQIFGFTFGTMVNNQTETCASNYTDYTGTIAPVTVSAGSVVPFVVKENECDGATFYSNGCSIFIDFNRDGDWLDAGEQVFTTTATAAATGASPAGDLIRSGNIYIPLSASSGVTRMRVIVAENIVSPTSTQAFSYGEQEDYLVNILSTVSQNPLFSYSWSPGGASTPSTIVNPINPGNTTIVATYTVTVSDATCPTTGSVTVNVNPVPSTPIGIPSTQCGLRVPLASVSGGGGIFNWYLTQAGGLPIPGETGNSLTNYSIATTTTFYVSEYDGICESGRAVVIANVTNPDPVTANAGVAPFCKNSVIQLTQSYTPVQNTYSSWTWTAQPLTGSGLSGPTPGNLINGSLNVTPTAAGTFTYSVTSSDGNCNTISFVVVTVNDLPLITASAGSSTICAGSSTTLTAISQSVSSGPQVLPTGYCVSSLHTAAGPCIYNVTFENISNNTSASLCALPSNTNVTPGAGTTTNVLKGNSYSLNVTLSGVGYSYAWIDWDRNGAFNTTTEYYSIISNGTTGTLSITVPATAVNGLTLLRVRGRSVASTTNACEQYTSGETEDYTINIQSLVSSPNVTYLWNPGSLSNPANVSPGLSTTYTVTVNDGTTGCSTAASVPVTVINSASLPVASALPNEICISGVSNLSVVTPEPGVTYSWQYSLSPVSGPWLNLGTGVTISSGTLNLSTYFRVTASCGISSITSAPVLVTVLSPQVTGFTGGTRCGPGLVTANVIGTGDFDWYSAQTGGILLYANTSSITAIINVPSTIFWVQAKSGTCLATNRFAVGLTSSVAPSVTVTASPGTTICSNKQLTLTAASSNDPNYTYSWSTNGGTTTIFTGNPFITIPANTATYTVIATDLSNGTYAGCGSVATKSITVNQAPSIPIITPAVPAICSVAGCVDLTVAGASTNVPAIVTVGTGSTVNAASSSTNMPPYGNYFTGNRHQILVTASELQTLGMVAGNISSIAFDVVSNTNALGYNNFTILMGHTNATALTSTFETTPTTQVFNIGNYHPVPGWNTHNFNVPFSWDGVSNIIVETYFSNCLNCTGGNVCGTTGSGTTWTQNAVTNQTVQSFICHNFYYSDGNGCNTNTITTATSTTATRPNMQFNAITGSPVTYTWNPGNIIGPVANVCPTANTTYTVVASVPSGCSSSASTVVQYSPLANPVITANGPTTICPGNSVTLDAGSGFANYSWSDGTNVVASTRTYSASPASTTTYSVTVGNGAICTKSASQIVNVSNLPTPIIIAVGGNPTTFCQGGSVTLDAGSGYSSYSWSNGTGIVGTLQTLNVSTGGTYSVTVTLNGCSATSSGTTVTVNLNPTASITPSGPLQLCNNGSNSPLILTSHITNPGTGATISWNQDGNPSTNTISINAGDIDLLLGGNSFGYNFQVTNSFGCSAISNTVTVTEIPCSGTTLYAKLFLEGYYSGSGQMNTSGLGGCLFTTSQSLNPLHADYVTLSAMSSTSPHALIESQTGILKTDGTINVLFSSAIVPGSSYYLRVTHRNALETWSALPVIFSATSALNPYDFSNSQSSAYGNNLSDLFDGNWAIFSGDISDAATATIGVQDGIIESQDYGDMENAVYVTLLGYVVEDITGDGIVESADYGLMENNVYYTRVIQRP